MPTTPSTAPAKSTAPRKQTNPKLSFASCVDLDVVATKFELTGIHKYKFIYMRIYVCIYVWMNAFTYECMYISYINTRQHMHLNYWHWIHTGGFIKNAVLSALLRAISRDCQNVVITQDDLFEGVWMYI